MPRKILLITKKQDNLFSLFSPDNLKLLALTKAVHQNIGATAGPLVEKQISQYFTIRHDKTLVKTLAYINAINKIDDLLVLPYDPEKEISNGRDENYFSYNTLEEAEKIIGENILQGITDLDQIFLSIGSLRFTNPIEDLLLEKKTTVEGESTVEEQTTTNGESMTSSNKLEGFYFKNYEEFNKVKSAVLSEIKDLSNNNEVKKCIEKNWDFDNKLRKNALYLKRQFPNIVTNDPWIRELTLGLREEFFERLFPSTEENDNHRSVPRKYLNHFKIGYSVYRDDAEIENFIKNFPEKVKEMLDFLKTRADMFQLLIEDNYKILNLLTKAIINNKLLDVKLSDIIYFLPEKDRETFFDSKKTHAKLTESISLNLMNESYFVRGEFNLGNEEIKPNEIAVFKNNLLESLLKGFKKEERISIFRDFKIIDHNDSTMNTMYFELDFLLSPKHLEEYLSYLSTEEKIDYFENKKISIKSGSLPESNAVSVNILFSMGETETHPILEGLSDKKKHYYLNFPLEILIEKGLIEKNVQKVIEQIDLRYKYEKLYDLRYGGVERSIFDFLNSEAVNFFNENQIREIKDHIKTSNKNGEYSIHKPASLREEKENTTVDLADADTENITVANAVDSQDLEKSMAKQDPSIQKSQAPSSVREASIAQATAQGQDSDIENKTIDHKKFGIPTNTSNVSREAKDQSVTKKSDQAKKVNLRF